MVTKTKPQTADSDRAIDPSMIYPLPTFMALVGWGRWAMRTARRDGLPVIYKGGRAFVRGADFAAFMAGELSHAAGSTPTSSGAA